MGEVALRQELVTSEKGDYLLTSRTCFSSLPQTDPIESTRETSVRGAETPTHSLSCSREKTCQSAERPDNQCKILHFTTGSLWCSYPKYQIFQLWMIRNSHVGYYACYWDVIFEADFGLQYPATSFFRVWNITDIDSEFDFLPGFTVVRIPEVKFTVKEAIKAQRVQLYPSFNLGCTGGGWSATHPGHFKPGKETRYPLYRRLGGPPEMAGSISRFSSSLFQNGCVAEQTSFLKQKVSFNNDISC